MNSDLLASDGDQGCRREASEGSRKPHPGRIVEGTRQNLPPDRKLHGARCTRDDHRIPLRICHAPSLKTDGRNTRQCGLTVLCRLSGAKSFHIRLRHESLHLP